MQLKEDDGRRVDSPLLDTMGLKSLSYLCMEATGHRLHKNHGGNRPDAQKTIDDYSSVGSKWSIVCSKPPVKQSSRTYCRQ